MPRTESPAGTRNENRSQRVVRRYFRERLAQLACHGAIEAIEDVRAIERYARNALVPVEEKVSEWHRQKIKGKRARNARPLSEPTNH